MSSEIAIPFRMAPDGRIASETNPDRQIAQHVKSLVTTEPTERIMLPTYGVPLTSMLFDMDDNITQTHMMQLVTQALSTWEPGVLVIGIRPVNNVSGDGLAAIEVDYRRRESASSDIEGRKVNTAFIGVNGKVSEVVRG